jgi:hypothetical protein
MPSARTASPIGFMNWRRSNVTCPAAGSQPIKATFPAW